MALFKVFRGQEADLDSVPLHDGYSYVALPDDDSDKATFWTDAIDSSGELKRFQIGGSGGFELDRVYIDTPPTKTAYKAGEIFDPTGMVVKADFAISGVVVVSGQTIYDYTYPLTGLAAGTTAVTISVTKENVTKTVNQAVNVTKTEVAVPTLSGSYTYNGNTQTFQFNNEPNSSIATKSGDVSGLNAGSYTTRFTLNDTDLYVWADGSAAAYKNIAVTIGQKTPTLSASPASVTLSSTALTATSTITCDGDGTLSVQSSDTSVATASISGNTVTISSVNNTAGSATITVTHTAASGGNYSNGTTTIDVTASFIPTLEEATWAQISEASQAGEGDNYWDVGDTKSIALSGTCGTLNLSTTLYCYILGFDHNSAKEGTGIHFGTWKTAASGGIDVCLIDSYYGNYKKYDGTKCFQMNHWGTSSDSNTNYGGWKGCDMRYDILGSTKTAPSGYGAQATTSRVGYDAPTDTATSPVANTLMSCLPSALRAVMKPMTKYTDNYGNRSNVADHVTSSVDYLPLLSEWEIFGARSYANQYEQNSQAQYTYYSFGNSTMKYRHSSTGSTAFWWERSPHYNSADRFCDVSTTRKANYDFASFSYGLAPAFKV